MTKNSYSQIILYTKGWFETKDSIEDLKILVGARSVVDINYIHENDVILVLLNLIEEHIEFCGDNFKRPCGLLSEVLNDIDPNSMRCKMFGPKEWNFAEAVIQKLCGIISIMSVKLDDKEVPLDDPDFSLLNPSKRNWGL